MHHRTLHLSRPLRGLVVALTAIALSAGIVLAARPASTPPAAAAPGLSRAAEAAGKTVPVVNEAPTAPDEDADEADETTDEDAEAEDNEAADTDAESQPQNHGWFVSQAAKSDTPDGFANHGAYVSSIAKSDQGKAAAPAGATAGKAKADAAKAAAKTHKKDHTGH